MTVELVSLAVGVGFCIWCAYSVIRQLLPEQVHRPLLIFSGVAGILVFVDVGQLPLVGVVMLIPNSIVGRLVLVSNYAKVESGRRTAFSYIVELLGLAGVFTGMLLITISQANTSWLVFTGVAITTLGWLLRTRY